MRNVFGTEARVEKPISMLLRDVPNGGAFGGNEIVSGGYAGLGLIVGGQVENGGGGVEKTFTILRFGLGV